MKLWSEYNEYIIHIVENTDEGCLDWAWKRADGDLTLDFLVRDYYRHLEWHRELFERRAAEIKASRKR